MAEEKKSRLTFLLLGVLIGLVIGVMALLVVQFNNKPANDEKVAESTIERIADKVLTLLYLKKEKEEPKEENAPALIVNNNKSKTSKITDSTAIQPQVVAEADSVKKNYSDTVSVYNEIITEEDITIKKDEFIESRNIDVVIIGDVDMKSQSDSLLEETADVQIEKNNSKVSFTVEFWKSPINYRGYKMGKNKLILFGINPDDTIKLYWMEDEMYLKLPNVVYHMEMNNDFRSYERVIKPSILALLK